MTYESLFVDPRGRTSRRRFLAALVPLALAAALYAVLVKGRTGEWCLLVLIFPALVLHARRLHDMGRTAWLLVLPAVLLLAASAVRLKLVGLGAQLEPVITPAALVVSAAFLLWGLLGKGQAEPNRFGEAAPA